MIGTSHALGRGLMATLAFTLLLSSTAVAAQEEEEPSRVPEPTAIVDINSAPVEDIRAVVSDEELAQRIVDNRPYANKRQLLSRRLVTAEQYETIRDRIVARRMTPAPER